MTFALVLALGWALGGSLPAAGPGVPAAHPNSLSASRVDLRGTRVVHAIEVQVLSLAEVLQGFDEDLDGRVPAEVLARDSARIADHLAAHYRLAAVPAGAEGTPAAWRPLGPPRATSVREAAAREGLFGELEQYVRVDLVYEAEAPFDVLGLDVDLFVETSPEHRDLCVVVWNGVELEAFDLGGRDTRAVPATGEVLARGAAPFGRYVARVARGAAGEWEVLALALLIAVSARSARGGALAGLVFGLAVAGGAALTPSLTLDPRGLRFVALAVPLATAYVGLDALLARAPRTRALEALVFGAVAGARLASRHAAELAREAPTEFQPASDVAPALAGLAVGGFGLAVVGTLVPLGLGVQRRPKFVRAAAALGVLAGGAMFGRLAFGA